MSVHERIGRNQAAVLAALHHTNEAVLDLIKPVLTMSESFPRVRAQVPIADGLPTPEERIELWFGFLEGVLKEEKDFLLRVVGLLPDSTVKPTTAKPAAKAA